MTDLWLLMQVKGRVATKKARRWAASVAKFPANTSCIGAVSSYSVSEGARGS